MNVNPINETDVISSFFMDTKNTDPEKQIEKKCEKLTREVSIKFSEWLIRKCDFQEDKTWLYKGMDFSIKDLFEIFEHDVG